MSAKLLTMPRKSAKPTATIRVEVHIARWIEVICLAEDLNSSDVTSPILEEALKSRYLKALAALNKESKDLGQKKDSQ